MVHFLGVAVLCLVTAQEAAAQRADANAVTTAQDAFGSSVNGDSLGLYDSRDVRSFDPVSLGNIRIDGLYFDRQGGFTTQLIESSVIRVGINTVDYAFPAPSGIVDYHVRGFPGEDETSLTAGLGPESSPYLELDFAKRLAGDYLFATGGAALNPADNHPSGGASSFNSAALNLIVKPSNTFTAAVFGSRIWDARIFSEPVIYLQGGDLPLRTRPEPSVGQWWAYGHGSSTTLGARADWSPAGAWSGKLGLFYSEKAIDEGVDQTFDQTDRSGVGRLVAYAYRDHLARSVSGEARMGYSQALGILKNILEVSVRGRLVSRRFGGEEVLDLGRADINEFRPVHKPSLADARLQDHDEISQLIAGVRYKAEVDRVGLLSVAVQGSRYQKAFSPAAQPPAPAQTMEQHSDNFLVNASLAAPILNSLTAYVGYSQGLEEGGVAPADAVNRYQVLPMVRSQQYEIGLRYLRGQTTVDAALFEEKKPQASIDPSSVFRLVGTIRNRGVETSVSAMPFANLKIIAGLLLLRPTLFTDGQGPALDEKQPIGVPTRRTQLNVDYAVPALGGLSLDAHVNHTGAAAVTTDRLVTLPDHLSIDVGFRIPFKVRSSRWAFRAQVTNLFDDSSWLVDSNGGLTYTWPRTLNMALTSTF